MGEYYNKGWSVSDTNRLAFIVRRWDPGNKLDKKCLHDYALAVRLNRQAFKNLLTEDEIEFICNLPVEEKQCVSD